MPNSLGLNRSLGGAVAVIAVVSILCSGAVLVAFNHLHHSIAEGERSSQTIRAIDEFRGAMLNQETGLRGYLITGRSNSLEPYNIGRPALDKALSDLRALTVVDETTDKLAAEAEMAARTWQRDIGEAALRAMSDSRTKTEAFRIEADGRGKALFDTFREKLSAIEDAEAERQRTQHRQLLRAARAANATLWIGTFLIVACCIVIGFAINRLIVRPLGMVMAFVEQVGNGDLTGQISTMGRNEIGRLSRTLNGMASGLANLAHVNRVTTIDLNAATAEIRASAQEQAASVEEQFAAVQETAATVDEMTRSGEKITKRASEVIAAAEATVSTAHLGLRAATETANAMEAIRQQGSTVSDTIISLTDKAEAIGDIIAVINDLSERTHLLALNAAIQADAAGESGRGFVVVSAEMKLLADRAKASTDQVRAILLEIQQDITTSATLTHEAVNRAERGKSQADATLRAIDKMVVQVEESVQAFRQIIISTGQQQLGIEQVMAALQNIRQASQEAAIGTRQVESASAGLIDLAAQLLVLADRYRLNLGARA